MKKRFISSFLVTIMLLSFIPIVSSAAMSGECGDNATWVVDDKTLTISGTGEIYHGEWGRYNDIEEIIISNGITNIYDYTFDHTTDLKYVTLPETLQTIGDGAFASCSLLRGINMPYGLVSIGSRAFYRCDDLSSVTFYDKLKSIGDFAFYDSGLRTISIPESVTNIGVGALASNRIKEINVDNNNPKYCSVDGMLYSKDKSRLIQYASAKYSGYDTTWFEIPSNVTAIGDYAFCLAGVKRLEIPPSVKAIGYSFPESDLSYISVDENNQYYSSEYGVLFNKNLTELVYFPPIDEDTTHRGTIGDRYEIPSSVTSIYKGAFERCNLSNITIPNSVRSIGERAFRYSTFSSIKIPNGVKSIGEQTFAGCVELTDVTLPTTLESIGDDAFARCSIDNIKLPQGLKTIGEYAFDGCNLSNINLPNSITSIGEGAFGYTGITEIQLPNQLTAINDDTFLHCRKLTSVSIPSSVKRISYAAFLWCDNLNSVYYEGSQSQWHAINIEPDNDCLTNATIYYNSSGDVRNLFKWNYIPTEYSHRLALECAKLSAAIYPKYHLDDRNDIFYEAGEGKLIKGVLSYYDLINENMKSLSLGENGINYIITRSRKNVNYNGSVRPVVYVICKGTTGSEWYGNMDITGKSYSSAEKNHKSFQIAATALEGKIGEYIKNNELSNALVIVTGHSRGAAVANLTAYDLTMGKVSGVDKNGVYGYTFACPSTTQNPDTSLKNIYNFSFADDFVPAFPLDAWGYGKHGETHVASADFLKINNSSFRNNINKILQMSEGRDASFAYARTKALFKYVPTKWGSISDYYNGHPLTYVSMPNAKMPENLTLYHFVHDFLAEYMATKSKKSIAGMVSTVTSHVYRPIVAYLVDGGAAEGFMNDNHQMYTYYEALKTGKFDEKEYLPSGWDYFNISLFSESEPAEYNSEQVAALKAFISNGDNAEYLGWDAEDPETWETVTWNSAGNVETISFYYTGLSGELDLSGFSDLRQFICPGNQITELKLSGCDSLDVVDCTDNLLEELDVTSLNLKALSCEYNYLDTENMTNIEALVENGVLVSYAHQNIKPEAVYSEADIAALKTILTNSEIWDLSESPSEWYGITWEKQDGIYRCVAIDLRGLGITDSIEVSGMDALISFFCSDNELGSLKISDCPALAYLSCSECNLTEFEVSGTELEFINCENNYLDADTVDAVSQLVDAENGGIAENSQLTDATLTPLNGYSSKIKAKAQYSDKMFTITITPLAEITDADFKVIQAEYDSNNVLKGIYEVTCEQQEDGSYICSDGIDGKCRIFVWDSVDGMKPVFEPLNIKFN